MASVRRLTEMLYRIKEGESCKGRDWDNKILPRTVREILKKYELAGTYNPKIPVNQDMELADRFFKAGLELAETLGIFCTDTESVIKFNKKELLYALEQAPSELKLGRGADQILLKARAPEDKVEPIFCTSLSIQIDEEIYPELVSGMLTHKNIDMLQGPSLDTVFGLPALSETPFETAAGINEVKLRQEALWRVGRPGIPQQSMSSSVTEFGFMTAFALNHNPLNPQMAIILQPAEMKTNYSTFNKALTGAAFDSYIRAGCPSMIGGYSGSPEGAALANIASDILQFAMLDADVACCSIIDVRENTVCNRAGLWSLSISVQATSRNTHTIHDKIINQTAGPCTPDILYTSAAGLIASCASGMEMTTGPRSAGGELKNFITPLEAHFCSDVFKSAANLSLGQALDLVEFCLSKYELEVANQPRGKSYYDCYNRSTLQPIDEWQYIDEQVRKELSSRGLDI